MCPAAAAAAGYNPCPGSNPQVITCPGGELIRSPKTLTLIISFNYQRFEPCESSGDAILTHLVTKPLIYQLVRS